MGAGFSDSAPIISPELDIPSENAYRGRMSSLSHDGADAAPSIPFRILIGNVESECPHCSTPLAIRPARKARCPECRNFIYVRTRPADRVRVLVSQEQAAQIDAQWLDYRAATVNVIDAPSLVHEELGLVEKRLGRLIAITEFKAFLEIEAQKHLYANQLGLYRHVQIVFAALLATESRKLEALQLYMEVLFLDECGATNASPGWPRFQLQLRSIAPGIVGTVRFLAGDLGLGIEALGDLFRSSAAKYATVAPLTAEQAWSQAAPCLRS